MKLARISEYKSGDRYVDIHTHSAAIISIITAYITTQYISVGIAPLHHVPSAENIIKLV